MSWFKSMPMGLRMDVLKSQFKAYCHRCHREIYSDEGFHACPFCHDGELEWGELEDENLG